MHHVWFWVEPEHFSHIVRCSFNHSMFAGRHCLLGNKVCTVIYASVISLPFEICTIQGTSWFLDNLGNPTSELGDSLYSESGFTKA